MHPAAACRLPIINRPLTLPHHPEPSRCARQVPAGSLPRTMEVVLRNEQVEQARAGDKLVFTGNLVVVPDIAMLTIPGERVQVGRRGARPIQTLYHTPMLVSRVHAILSSSSRTSTRRLAATVRALPKPWSHPAVIV